MASIDAKTFCSINGDQGGTWAPSSVITIGGAGISITSNSEFTHSLTVGTNAADTLISVGPFLSQHGITSTGGGGIFCDFITVSSTSIFAAVQCSTITASSGGSFGGNVGIGGDLTVGGGASITGNGFVSGLLTASSLSVTGNTTNTGNITVTGSTQTNGSLTTVGNLNVANGATFTANPAIFSANARPVRAPALGATSGGGTFSPQQASQYLFLSGMSAQSYALGTVGVVDGDVVNVALQLGVNNTLTVTGALGGSLLMKHSATNDIWGATFMWFASITSWVPVMATSV